MIRPPTTHKLSVPLFISCIHPVSATEAKIKIRSARSNTWRSVCSAELPRTELPHCYGALRMTFAGWVCSEEAVSCCFLCAAVVAATLGICMQFLLRCANANPIRVCQKRVAVAPVSTVGILVEQTSQDAKHKARGGSNLGGHSRQGQSEKNLLGKEGVQGSRM